MQVRFAVRRKERNGQGICRNCESSPLRAVDPRLHTKAPAILAFEVRARRFVRSSSKSIRSVRPQQDKPVDQGQTWLMPAIRTRQPVLSTFCVIFSAALCLSFMFAGYTFRLLFVNGIDQYRKP